MKRIGKTAGKIIRQTLWVALVGLTAGSAMAAGDEMEPYANATRAAHDGTLLSSGRTAAGEPDLYLVEVPFAGVLTVDVTTPVSAAVPAKLALYGEAAPGQTATLKNLRVVERSVAGLLLFVGSPGTYHFAVAAQDPRQALGEYKLTTGFHPLSGLDPDSVDESEPDPDPDSVDESEPDPDPDSVDESEPDPDPDSLRLPGPRWEVPGAPREPEIFRDLAAEICRVRARDDHADSFLCATVLDLRTEVTGEIDSFSGDDDDVFSFVLGDQRTIRIETDDGLDTVGELYDRFGHRLAADDDSGEGTGLRIVKTLGPGRYFVRIAGASAAEGSYTLTATVLGW